jgi:hypothetical protein
MLTRFQKSAVTIALAICFVFAFGAEVWRASHSPQAPQQSNAAYNANKSNANTNKEGPDEAIARYNFWLMIFTGVLAVATIVLGTITGFQLRLARAELIQTHRPRIILRDVWLEKDKGEILYMLINVGGTKATIVESWVLAEFIQKGGAIRPLRSYGHDDLGKLTFAAGEMKDLTYRIPSGIAAYIRFPDMMRIGVEDKPPMIGHFYFTGAILYSDDAGNKRRSVFRRRWDTLWEGFHGPEEDQEYAD